MARVKHIWWLGALLLAAWPTANAQAQKKDKALSKWMQTVITTYDFKADPATHEVNCIFHFAKAAQGPG